MYARGGYFPSTYSNNPEIVINNRKQSRDRFLFNPKYELNNYNYDRTLELRKQYQKSQIHREQYGDRSGELHPVKVFVVPIKNQKMNESFLP